MCGGREAGYVEPDLGDDHMHGGRSHSDDLIELVDRGGERVSMIESARHTIPAMIARIFVAGVAPPFAAIFTRLLSKAGQSAAVGQCHDRDQPGTRFGSVEPRADRAAGMG